MDLLYRIVDQVLAGDPQILLLFLTFSSVMLLVLGGVGLVGARDRVAQRLQDGAKVSPGKTNRKVTLRVGEHESLLHRLFRPLYQYVVPKDQKRYAVLRQRLMQAGYFGPSAMHFYFTVRVCLAVALPVLTAFTLPLALPDLELQSLLLTIVGTAFGGLYLPSLWVLLQIRKRQQAVREGFPDALDLLLVCVEAGLSLDAALNRVGTEIGRPHPVLGEHLRLISLELRAGKSRENALRNFSERVGIEDVRTLVTLLVQSENLGTSIAQALRVHAYEMRNKRVMRAEEKANMLPVKLSIPLVLCILPALMAVLMIPAVLRIMRLLLPTMGAG